MCNQVMYTILHDVDTKNLDIPAGFIHLPSLPEQVADEQPMKPSMSLETLVKGIDAVIEVLNTQKT